MTSKAVRRRGLACAALAGAVAWAVPATAAQVSGRVVLEGEPPEPEWIEIEPKTGVHSTEGCGSLRKTSRKIRIGPEGGLQDAVVWLEVPLEEGPDRAVILDQKECVFDPHVAVMRPGETLRIRNSDPVLHNVRIFQEGNPGMLMHRWQKADASDIHWRFSEPGRYIVRCGVHPWMYAWVVVLPTKAASVTNPSGRFTIPGVPQGRHLLRVWHETMGTREVPLEVGASDLEMEAVGFAPYTQEEESGP